MKKNKVITSEVIFLIGFVFSSASYAIGNENIVNQPPENKIVKTKIEEPEKPSLGLKNFSNTTESSKTDTLDGRSQIGVSNYLQMILGLLGILIFIFAIAWLIKRMGTLSPIHSSNLKVIAGLNVGQREKIIVIQVMDEQLLVGVTQNNIRLLSKLEQSMPSNKNQPFGGFQEKLQAAILGVKNKNTNDGASSQKQNMAGF